MKKTNYLLILVTVFLFACNGNTEDDKAELKEEMQTENEMEMANNQESQSNGNEFKLGIYEYHLLTGTAVKYEGNIVTGETWTDKNGKNIVIFTSKEILHEESKSTYLYAYHYTNSGTGFELIREVKDSYEKCDIANHTAFQKEYIKVTDMDNDGYGEITFTYRTGCNGDPTPVTQKLLLLENGEKYAIRGTTLIDGKKFGIGENTYGGKTNIDPSFDKAPAEFLNFAKEIWDKAYIY